MPLVSVQQLLDWTDGRNNSHFAKLTRDDSALTFEAFIDQRTGTMLRGMIPASTSGKALSALSRDGLPVDHETEIIKGIAYARAGGRLLSNVRLYRPEI